MSDPIQHLHRLLDPSAIWHRQIVLKRGQPLVLAGSVDRNIYRVEEGTLMCCVEVAGARQCTRFGYAGDYVMAVDAYITGAPTRYTFEALRRTRVAVATYADHTRWLGERAEHGEAWEAGKGWLITGLLQREIDLLTPSPEERYRRVLERSPRLFQEVPAKYIANYLRMSPETLSRIGRGS